MTRWNLINLQKQKRQSYYIIIYKISIARFCYSKD